MAVLLAAVAAVMALVMCAVLGEVMIRFTPGLRLVGSVQSVLRLRPRCLLRMGCRHAH